MSVGPSAYLANSILDAVYGSGAAFAVTTAYIQLHLDDPGAAGTDNQALETDRATATFGAASGGIITTSGATTWTAVIADELVTHWTAWDAPTGGNFLHSGTLSGFETITAADFTLAAGQLVISFIGIAA